MDDGYNNKNLKSEGVASSKATMIFPSIQGHILGSPSQQDKQKGWWTRWEGSWFFQSESWVDFSMPFSSNDVCIDALWC